MLGRCPAVELYLSLRDIFINGLVSLSHCQCEVQVQSLGKVSFWELTPEGAYLERVKVQNSSFSALGDQGLPRRGAT
jgi:hypothetical protein